MCCLSRNCFVIFIVSIINVFIMISICFAQAQNQKYQTNFSIAPPPLGYPEYPDQFTLDGSLNAQYSRAWSDDFTFNFFAGGFGPRFGMSHGALNTPITLYLADITFGTGDQKMTGFMLGYNFTPSLEIPIIYTETFKLIPFVGYDINGSYLYINAGELTAINVYTFLHGFVAGAQFHIAITDNLLVSPFAMLKVISGSTDVEVSSGYYDYEYSYSIPTYKTMTYGFDIIETSTRICLSTMLQLVNQVKDQQAVKMITIGITLKSFGAAKSKSEPDES